MKCLQTQRQLGPYLLLSGGENEPYCNSSGEDEQSTMHTVVEPHRFHIQSVALSSGREPGEATGANAP
jgi:hypothetical protein